MERFDALVIGGGPAGSTAAILLAEAGWSVAVVERKAFPRRKVCGEYLSGTNWPLLERLGVAKRFGELAGPPVCATALFAGWRRYDAPLPRVGSWGRALGRESLDALLLDRARELGVAVFQPAACDRLNRPEATYSAIVTPHDGPPMELTSPVVIAAHGSWDLGPLPTQRGAHDHRSGDWLAFKAHFTNTALPAGLMPLLSFEDGYGGMVHCDGGRASLSCCIRRQRFNRLPRPPGTSAGDAVLAHILESCPVLRPILQRARLADPWLSAGPIQPGIRPRCRDGVFVVGNAAGEAHPVVAEGISMAMQSAWLLVERLNSHKQDLNQADALSVIGQSYSSAWRKAFAPRICAASAIAHWASHPRLVQAAGPLLATIPSLLTLGARLSGKSHIVVQQPAPSLARP